MTINSTTRKTNSLVGNGNTHTYPFAFKVFTDADIVVKKLEASTSIETTLTLGLNNDYIVTLNADQNSNPGGSITLKSGGNNSNLASGFSIVITSAVQSLQGTDLTNQGGFFPEVINDALDKSAILHQQQQTELDRSIRFSLTNTIGSLEITENAAARANKVLGFDNLGEFNVVQELGTYRGNWTASRDYVVRDLVKDTSTNNIFFCNTAHTSSGSQPLTTNTNSANWDLIVDAATATTSSTNAASSATAAASSATAAASSQTAAASSATSAASSATTATTKASEATTAKTAAETAQTAAETAKTAAETALDTFDDRYLGAKSSDPTLDNDGNALIDGALYFNTTDNVTKVYDLGNTAWVLLKLTDANQTKVNTVQASISNVNSVAGSISNVNAVAGNATNINAVNSNASNINTVAGAASNVSNVSGSIANVNTVGGGIANVNTVAAEINNNKLQTVATNINAVVTAADDLNEATSEIDTVATNIANVNNVGNAISNVNTVAGAISNVNAVASNASNVNTVGGAITNVNNVGGSIANVNTVASNLSGVNSFAERYRTDNTGNNPSSSLNGGDLFYNQAQGKLLVYNSQTSAWEETQSVGNFFINTISSFSGTGGNSATFNGAAYKFTLSNAGQFAQQMLVSIAGVIQKPNTGTGQPSEGFALDGANIVFSSAPASGADFFIVTIGASVSIGTPSNNTVTSAILQNGSVIEAKLADSAITNAKVNASAAIARTKLANVDLVDDTSPQLGGTLSGNTHNIEMGDSSGTSSGRVYFGASQDLQIYHDGSNSYIRENGTGDLVVNTNSTISLNPNGGGHYGARIITGGAVELYHNNVKKFETFSGGIKVYDKIGVNITPTTALQFLDGGIASWGNSADLQIYHDGSHSRIVDTGTGRLSIQSNDFRIENVASSELMAKFVEDGAVELYHDNTLAFQTSASGATVIDGDNTVVLGLLTGNGQAGYLVGLSNDTVLIQSGTGETMAGFNKDGSADLYYDNSKKLETTSYGVNVISNSSSNGLRVHHSNGNEVARLAHNGSGDEGVMILRDSNIATVSFNAEVNQVCHITGPHSLMLGTGGTGIGNSQRGIQLSAVTSGNPVLMQTSSSHYTGGAYSHWYIYDDHGVVGSVNADGDGTASFNSTSDYRLKENAVLIADGITKLKTLKPYRFNFKTANASKVVQGFFAHEVSEAVPNAVKGTKDEMKSLYYEEGDTIPEGKAVGDFKEYSTTEINPQSLDHAKLVPLLTAALQEAIAKIEVLETKVAALGG